MGYKTAVAFSGLGPAGKPEKIYFIHFLDAQE